MALLPQPCYPPGAKGGPGTPRRHPLPQRPCRVLIQDHSTLPRAGERRRPARHSARGAERAIPTMREGPFQKEGLAQGLPDPGATATQSIPKPSPPSPPHHSLGGKLTLNPAPHLISSTQLLSNTIFIPISQMGKLRLREVKQLGSSSQQESELRAHACFPSPVPETGESPGKVEGSWGPADLPRTLQGGTALQGSEDRPTPDKVQAPGPGRPEMG